MQSTVRYQSTEPEYSIVIKKLEYNILGLGSSNALRCAVAMIRADVLPPDWASVFYLFIPPDPPFEK